MGSPKDFDEVYARLSKHVTPEKSRKLELLEVERIRRIKATEEKYLRQTQDKYGELKKRRSQAYQSEKEISKYKRDYAVAKQKLWEARMQLLDNMYMYNMGSHTVPLTMDGSKDPAHGVQGTGRERYGENGRQHNSPPDYGAEEVSDDSYEEEREAEVGPALDAEKRVERPRSAPRPVMASTTPRAGALSRLLSRFLFRRAKNVFVLARWGVLAGCQVVEDVSVCSDYVLGKSLALAVRGVRLLRRRSESGSGRTEEGGVGKSGRRDERASPNPQVVRAACYALGMASVYLLNEGAGGRVLRLGRRAKREAARTALVSEATRGDKARGRADRKIPPEAIVLTTEVNKTSRAGQG